MTKSEIKILKCILRGQVYWGSYSNVHGNRAHNAAIAMRDAGLVKVVSILRLDMSQHRYVVIPPNAEWDDVNLCIKL